MICFSAFIYKTAEKSRLTFKHKLKLFDVRWSLNGSQFDVFAHEGN